MSERLSRVPWAAPMACEGLVGFAWWCGSVRDMLEVRRWLGNVHLGLAQGLWVVAG